MKMGKVFLVGAGPGEEGLITVKGLNAIQQADVILYDRLVNMQLIDSAPGHCELIYCGKLPQNHFLRQEQINNLLVTKALEGKIVVRLKGGDPGVFGRVGEEAASLVEHGIEFEVVPGITSGIAASMYAGIPITHREYGVSFAIVSAHDRSNKGEAAINWEGLVNSVDTIAFYMGVSNISHITGNLLRHGKSPDTPVILIQWGTYGRQKTLTGTLSNIAEKVETSGFKNPAITLVGDIVELREKLNWFEKKPLFGRQILLARTSSEQSILANVLKSQGADVIEFPKWKKTRVQIDEIKLNKIRNYDRILFTSPESIDDFFNILMEKQIDVREIKANLFGASSKSIKALQKRGLIGSLESLMQRKGNLLIVGDQVVRNKIAQFLEKYGEFDTFQTSEKRVNEKFLFLTHQMLDEANINTIIFPSAASVEVLIEQANASEINIHNLLNKATICCMGPSSWNLVEKYGYKPKLMSSEPTNESILDCLIKQEF